MSLEVEQNGENGVSFGLYESSMTPPHFLPNIESENESVFLNNSSSENSNIFINNETSMIYWPLRDPLAIVIPITVIYGLILIIGILGNMITCVVIIRSRYLHTTTNYYLFSLAVSDLLLLLSGLPAEMHSIWRRYPDVFGEIFCIGRGLASETSANATVLTITAFTFERYLAICHPFIIQKWENKLGRVVRQICVIWAIAICLAVPQALQLGLIPMPGLEGDESLICSVKSIVIEHSFEIATFVFFVGPMILITCLYICIGATLRNSGNVKETKLRLRKSLSSNKREVGQQRVLKMLVAVVAAFFICWAPFHAQRLIAIWGVTWLESSESLRRTYHVLTYISGILYYLSTCINPILYHIMSLKFRHAFQEMITSRDCCCSSSYNISSSRRNKRNNSSLNNANFNRLSLSARSATNTFVLTELSTTTTTTHSPHIIAQNIKNGKTDDKNMFKVPVSSPSPAPLIIEPQISEEKV